jgi:hypothetical protein
VPVFDPVASHERHLHLRAKQHPDIFNKDWVVKEDVQTAFAKLNIDTQAGPIPLRGARPAGHPHQAGIDGLLGRHRRRHQRRHPSDR